MLAKGRAERLSRKLIFFSFLLFRKWVFEPSLLRSQFEAHTVFIKIKENKLLSFLHIYVLIVVTKFHGLPWLWQESLCLIMPAWCCNEISEAWRWQKQKKEIIPCNESKSFSWWWVTFLKRYLLEINCPCP